MAAFTFTFSLFLVLYGSSHLHIKVDPPGEEQDVSSVLLKLRTIQQNREVCNGETPFKLSVHEYDDRTQLGYRISLADERANGKGYLSVDDDSGLATFSDQSSATLFSLQFENLGTAERDGIGSCEGFFLSTNSSGELRILHLTGRQNPHFGVYANKPDDGSTVVLGLTQICSTESKKAEQEAMQEVTADVTQDVIQEATDL